MTLLDESTSRLLEPGIDIEQGMQKRILQFERYLTTANHYELLGVPVDAEKKAIKSAYYALMNEFHTDKYFGKNLGSFAPRMARIVEALTRANDTLGRKKTREEYDAVLDRKQRVSSSQQSATVGRSQRPSENTRNDSGRRAVAPIDFVRIPGAPRMPHFSENAAHAQPSRANPSEDILGKDSSPPRRPGSELPPRSTVPPETVPPASWSARGASLPPHTIDAQAPASEAVSHSSSPSEGGDPLGERGIRSSLPPPNDARRRMLARKMGARTGGRSPEEQRLRGVKADLRARYDARRGQEADRVEHYRTVASQAVQKQSWSEAVNAMKMALSLKPADPGLTAEVEAVQAQADRALAPKFLEQARMEERDGRHEHAARSYERAARGFASAELFNKGALCLLSSTSLPDAIRRKAVELARQAVSLDKRKVPYRITLARAYDAAGMRSSALGELNRALEIEPSSNEAKELHKRLK